MNSSFNGFNELRNNLINASNQSNPKVQRGWCNTFKANTRQDFFINTVRNDIGDVIHGNQNSTAKSYFNAFIHEGEEVSQAKLTTQIGNIKECFGAIKNSTNKTLKEIQKTLADYCQFITDTKNATAEEINEKSALFFKNILNEIPDAKKAEGKLYLKQMIKCSAHFINEINLLGEERNRYIQSYLTATESFVNLLFTDENEGLNENNKNVFKDILLISTSFAGMLCTYQKRNKWDKIRIGIKQAFIPFAYVIGAIAGTAISHYLTTAVVTNTFLAISSTLVVGSIFPPILISIIGLGVGYVLTKMINKGLQKLFEKAERNINGNIYNIINKRLKLINKDDEGEENIEGNYGNIITRESVRNAAFNHTSITYEQNEEQIEGAPDKILNPLVQEKLSGLKEAIIDKETSTKIHWNKQVIVEFFNLLCPENSEERIKLNELFALLHSLVNCSEGKSQKSMRLESIRIKEILHDVIPAIINKEDKKLIFEAAFILAFNARPLSTAALRLAFTPIYVLFDVCTDILGMQASDFMGNIISHLPTAASLGAELGANLTAGIAPVGIGLVIYLGMKLWAQGKDKKEVLLPNEYIITHIKKHLELEKEQMENGIKVLESLHKLNTNQENGNNEDAKFIDIIKEINLQLSENHQKEMSEGKFTVFQIPTVNGQKYNLDMKAVSSFTDIPKGYFIYPLNQTNQTLIREEIKILEGEIKNLTEEMKKKQPKETSVTESPNPSSSSLARNRGVASPTLCDSPTIGSTSPSLCGQEVQGSHSPQLFGLRA